MGFDGKDVEITIDFEKETIIKSISMRFHNGNGQWIYAPKKVIITATLKNGKVLSLASIIKNRDSLLVNLKIDVDDFMKKERNITTSKIKLTIPNYGIIPDGKQGAGHRAWLFIDEIIVE